MDNKQNIKIMKAMANQTRMKILNVIKDNPYNVCLYDFIESLKIPMTTLHFHLKKLDDAGLLKSKQRKQKVLYAINQEALKELKKYFSYWA